MTWDLTWGPSVEYLTELKELGQDPQALRDRPVLETYLAYYVEAFIEIKDGRSYSSGGEPLPVPPSEILSYCELYGITTLIERERLIRMVRVLDKAYRKVAAEQAAQEAANKPTS